MAKRFWSKPLVTVPRSSLGDIEKSGYFRKLLRRESMYYLTRLDAGAEHDCFETDWEYLKLKEEIMEALEKNQQPVCNCDATSREGEKLQPWEHKVVAMDGKADVGKTCPAWRPYYELAWSWLWNYPNQVSLNKRRVDNDMRPFAARSLALAMAFRWAYSDKNGEIDPRDLQSGKWIDRAMTNDRETSFAEAKRVWRAWKQNGAMLEYPDEFYWDGGYGKEFMGVGLPESIPELERD